MKLQQSIINFVAIFFQILTKYMAKQKVTVGDMINNKKKPTDKKKEFNLTELDEFLGGASLNEGWKPDRYLKVNDALEKALNHPEGIFQLGHTYLLIGHSDTGKTTALIEVAKACQKDNILPIFLVTELKWDFNHLLKSGFDLNRTEVVDEDTGEITVKYDGDFIYRDYETLPSIESIAEFINKCLKAQRDGKIQQDICFFIDSLGNVQSEQSIASAKKSNLWDAGAIATQFQRGVCKEINLTRKKGLPFFATLVIVNHATVNPHLGEYMARPTLDPLGGNGIVKMCTGIIQFGDITKSGTSNVKATKGGKEIIFGKRTKVQLKKYHSADVSTQGKIILVEHGFIEDDKIAIKDYTKKHSKSWVKTFGTDDFDIVDEGEDDDED